VFSFKPLVKLLSVDMLFWEELPGPPPSCAGSGSERYNKLWETRMYLPRSKSNSVMAKSPVLINAWFSYW
jgi:hypothetical protein